MQQLQAILMGSRGSIVKLIRRCPRVLEMERKELIVRLVGAKVCRCREACQVYGPRCFVFNWGAAMALRQGSSSQAEHSAFNPALL